MNVNQLFWTFFGVAVGATKRVKRLFRNLNFFGIVGIINFLSLVRSVKSGNKKICSKIELVLDLTDRAEREKFMVSNSAGRCKKFISMLLAQLIILALSDLSSRASNFVSKPVLTAIF